MPVRFTCPSCGRILSTATRKAGKEIDCPACFSPVTVEPIQSLVEPVLEAIPVADPVFVAEEPFREQSLLQHPGIFASVGLMVMVLTVVLWLGLRDPSGGNTEASAGVALQEERPRLEVRRPKVEIAPEVRNEPETKVEVSATPQAAGETAVVLAKASEERDTPAAAPPAPIVAPEPPPPEVKPVTFKRRSEFSDEDLRKQLLHAPEVNLDQRSAQLVINLTRISQARGIEVEGPELLLKQRPDLFAMPMLMGADCHLGKEPAEHLQILSRKLRGFVEASIAKESIDVRPDAERLRYQLLTPDQSIAVNSTIAGRRVTNLVSGGSKEWLVPEAIPTLQQLLMSEGKPVRLLLIELLAEIKGKEATIALAQRVLFDLSPEVRDAAVNALKDRPIEDARPTLVKGLRYPWAPAADHAAEALVKLNDAAAIPLLVTLLKEPDPKLPAIQQRGGKESYVGPDLSQAPAGLREVSPPRDTHMVREVVRVNHLNNCLMCHAPSFDSKDDVRGRLPIPGQTIPSPGAAQPYYEGNSGTFVRADITYLKQDFSVNQPVANAGVWPTHQRFDYLVRTRMPTVPEMNELARHKLLVKEGKSPAYPQREAVLYVLRHLTGKDVGTAAAEWEGAVKGEE